MRVKATIAYDGSRFYGSQVQREKSKNVYPTVASQIETLLKYLNIHTQVEFSGRTDRGVHATGQVVAFEVPDYWSDLEKLRGIINEKLDEIRFHSLEVCGEDFQPRFGARSRVYRYIISTEGKNPFMYDYVHFTKHVDEAKISEAIKWFEGEHDFEFFRKTGSEEKSTVRKIYKTKFYRYRQFYIFYFEGNSFLRSQIRMMVGALLKYSDGMISASQLQEQIAKKAQASKIVAPPNGLYLAQIKY